MKKNLLILAFCLISTCAFAGDKEDVATKFEAYVNAANSYSNTVSSFYTNNAKIIRVVNKKQGGQKWIVIPFDRYVKELNRNSILARTVGYKNRYENRKISKIGNDYKISTTRIPRNDLKGLPCYFIFTKVNGSWKIREESMETNVQAFLNAK